MVLNRAGSNLSFDEGISPFVEIANTEADRKFDYDSFLKKSR